MNGETKVTFYDGDTKTLTKREKSNSLSEIGLYSVEVGD